VKTPTEIAVINTPIVASEKPCHKMGRMLSHFVSKPPEKRIKFNATTPRSLAVLKSLKKIPPGPSDPASIPTTRKSMSEGMPIWKEVLLAIMLRKRSNDPKSKTFSTEKVMERFHKNSWTLNIMVYFFI